MAHPWTLGGIFVLYLHRGVRTFTEVVLPLQNVVNQIALKNEASPLWKKKLLLKYIAVGSSGAA